MDHIAVGLGHLPAVLDVDADGELSGAEVDVVVEGDLGGGVDRWGAQRPGLAKLRAVEELDIGDLFIGGGGDREGDAVGEDGGGSTGFDGDVGGFGADIACRGERGRDEGDGSDDGEESARHGDHDAALLGGG